MSQHFSAVGVIATDPKIFTPEGGAEFCTFRIACTERRYDAQRKEWADGETNWFTVNTFRTLATHAHLSFTKGDRVIVSGRLRVRSWEKDEKRGTSVEIDADGLGHDLRWGTSAFTKRAGQTSNPSAGDAAVSREGEPMTQAADSQAPSSQTTVPAADFGTSIATGALSADNFTPQAEAAAAN